MSSELAAARREADAATSAKNIVFRKNSSLENSVKAALKNADGLKRERDEAVSREALAQRASVVAKRLGANLTKQVDRLQARLEAEKEYAATKRGDEQAARRALAEKDKKLKETERNLQKETLHRERLGQANEDLKRRWAWMMANVPSNYRKWLIEASQKRPKRLPQERLN